MTKGINKAILIGHLGADPELRYTQAGTPVANLSVATSETWKDKTTGAAQERTEWHRIVAFARLAEIMGQYLRKGSKVYIEGRIQTRKWQGQDGADRYTTEIVAHEMQMLGDGPKPASAAPPAANAERGFGRAHAGHVPGTPDPAAAYRNASQGRSVGQRGPRSAPPASPGDDIPF